MDSERSDIGKEHEFKTFKTKKHGPSGKSKNRFKKIDADTCLMRRLGLILEWENGSVKCHRDSKDSVSISAEFFAVGEREWTDE